MLALRAMAIRELGQAEDFCRGEFCGVDLAGLSWDGGGADGGGRHGGQDEREVELHFGGGRCN